MKQQLLLSVLLLLITVFIGNAHTISTSEATETYGWFEALKPKGNVEHCKTSVTSNPAILRNTLEVIIINQPQAITTLCTGEPLSLSVTATGTSLTYQWFKGTTALVGQTNPTLNIPQVTNANAGVYTVSISSSGEVITSADAVVIVNALPDITSQPFGTTVCEGLPINLTVVATGSELTYQWFKNGSPIAGATSATYGIASATLANAGDYTVTVSGACSPAVTSFPATIIVNHLAVFTQQPQSFTVCEGQAINLSVIVAGTNLSYQWYKGSTEIVGETNSNYNMFSTTVANSGLYTCVVTHPCGSITSNVAAVVVSNGLGAGATPCGDVIQLISFIDSNNNGIKENSESIFSYGSYSYQINNTGQTYYINNPVGVQNIYDSVTTNTYDFNYQINPEFAGYYAATPTNYNDLSIAAGSGVQTLYFPITITQVYNDVQINVTPLSVPRPGFTFSHRITYKNLGHTTLSGTITYTKNNASVAISSVSPLATATLSNGFTYDYSNLLPGQTRYINVNMLVATIPTVNLGDVLTHTVSITPSATDINLSNNSSTVVQTVVGSYDPNDKNEARGGNVQIGQFNANDYLFYTIRFQNSGTASAETVRIEDTLESEFNYGSIQMVSASHKYIMQRVNNKVIWTFNNINLPSENQDEPGSHGYVTFKIKLNPGFAVGDVIENTAEIYFDFNPAIITNTFQTTFVPNLSTSTFDENSIVVYPNPAKEMVQISLQHATESMSKVVIFDMIGKSIKTVSAKNVQHVQIPVSDLATGVYLIEITIANNLKQVRKFIVN